MIKCFVFCIFFLLILLWMYFKFFFFVICIGIGSLMLNRLFFFCLFESFFFEVDYFFFLKKVVNLFGFENFLMMSCIFLIVNWMDLKLVLVEYYCSLKVF